MLFRSYQIDSDNVKTYTLPSIGQNHSCGYCPTAYNMINQQILSMPIYYSSSLHWVVVDVPSQQVLINTEMPDSNYFAYLVSSPITGKYYGCRFNSFYVQGIFEIDPFNLTAVKIADFPNDYNGGYNDEYGMVDVATNKYIFPYYSINHENKLGICNLNDFTIQTILFPGGPDRNQLFNRPQNANMVYRNGKLFVTKGENYNWYLNDNIIQNTTVNYFTPTQSGYYKSEVLIGKAIYYTDSLYIDLTGIKEEYQTTFSLLPNPATNQLTVTLNQTAQNATLQILSIEGKQLTGTIPVTPQSTTVDVSTLPKGLYFIVLQDEKGKAVKKFIKQ